jgi:uncharacterized protein with PIN domain
MLRTDDRRILKSVELRFYEELNDFLSSEKRKTPFIHYFTGKPTIKDVIESLGVPHTEVDLILINGKSVDFNYHIHDGDTASIYPVFEALDISNLIRLREKALRTPAFILDVHLGKLAKYMRLLGLNTLYKNNYADAEIVRIAEAQKRIILTRDRGLLKIKRVMRGYWIRSTVPAEQTKEVMEKFDLYSSVKPFQRCLQCNGTIHQVKKESILDMLFESTNKYYRSFYRCNTCGNLYWEGSHYERMKQFVEHIMYAGKDNQ